MTVKIPGRFPGSSNLRDDSRDHPDSICAFMRDFDVPFDNNHPEREATWVVALQLLFAGLAVELLQAS
jgi:hypothetical protein